MPDEVCEAPRDARGLYDGQPRYINLPAGDITRILEELNEEPCELCGRPTKEAGGQLFAKDAVDDQGRKIILMVCPTCLRPMKSRRGRTK